MHITLFLFAFLGLAEKTLLALTAHHCSVVFNSWIWRRLLNRHAWYSIKHFQMFNKWDRTYLSMCFQQNAMIYHVNEYALMQTCISGCMFGVTVLLKDESPTQAQLYTTSNTFSSRTLAYFAPLISPSVWTNLQDKKNTAFYFLGSDLFLKTFITF